jgi:hypothetical protein
LTIFPVLKEDQATLIENVSGIKYSIKSAQRAREKYLSSKYAYGVNDFSTSI